MNKFSEILFWILTDTLLIFGITFLPSLFSIFCFIAAILFLPIEEWQNLLKKLFKKQLRAIIVAVCVAVIIAEFPLARVVAGIHKAINPPEKPNNFKVYYEEPTKAPNNTSSSSNNSYTTSMPVSSKAKVSSAKNEVNTSSYSSTEEFLEEPIQIESSKPTITNSEYVYRTPSGKRYHFSPTCGGKNSYEVSFDEAVDEGLTPCKKCAE